LKYVPPPGDLIRDELRKRGWTQKDLAQVIDQPISRINQIIQGKQSLSSEMAIALASALDIPAQEWITREFAYRRFLVLRDVELLLQAAAHEHIESPLQKRKRLFEIAPIKELQKRGWIRSGDDPSFIEEDLLKLLEVDRLDRVAGPHADMRKSAPEDALTPAQRAWCFRVRQIAKSLIVAEFKPDRLRQCEADLRKVAAYSQEVRKVPTILASYGIRFVVVEPLSGGKIDGMATWLEERSPVIGMSLRYDRIDNFWHTLCHEIVHIKYEDAFSADSFDSNSDSSVGGTADSQIEARANREAACMLVPREEMDSFIRRVSPLYSKERINQFANKLKIHPGIIVGQLHNRGEIGWSASRDMLVKIRQSVTPVALTDGWGNFIDPRSLR
jgi:HTH-type transcriptional regulator/antitoxin HigA